MTDLARALEPDFLVVGVQRAGTTWVHRNLRKHPEVWVPPGPLKEVHYFDELHLEGNEHRHERRLIRLRRYEKRQRERGRLTERKAAILGQLRELDRDDDWYRLLFSLAAETPGWPYARLGEITPSYSLLPDRGIEHILRLNPAMRLLLILRDPIERAWSQARLDVTRRQIRGRIEPHEVTDDALLARVRSPENRARTAYRDMIERFRRICPADQLRIDFYDNIGATPREFLRDTAEFIGVDPTRFPEDDRVGKRYNDATKIEMPAAVRDELLDTYGDTIDWVSEHVADAPASWRR